MFLQKLKLCIEFFTRHFVQIEISLSPPFSKNDGAGANFDKKTNFECSSMETEFKLTNRIPRRKALSNPPIALDIKHFYRVTPRTNDDRSWLMIEPWSWA